jgi:hypothetical protein
LLFGHFLLPFVLLLSRFPKRRPGLLVLPAAWVLIMHWVDIYWLAMPASTGENVGLSWLDPLCFVGIGGLCASAAIHWHARHSLLPVGDPRLPESITFENA